MYVSEDWKFFEKRTGPRFGRATYGMCGTVALQNDFCMNIRKAGHGLGLRYSLYIPTYFNSVLKLCTQIIYF